VLVRDGRIADDNWTLAEEGPARPGLIVPFDAWLEAPRGAGTWVEAERDVEDLVPDILAAPVVAVRFPAFVDGRGLSFGALLRNRFGYTGELRAFGDVLADLTEYLRRSGYNAFMFADRRQAETAIACLGRISDHYQASAIEPRPAFLRSTSLA